MSVWCGLRGARRLQRDRLVAAFGVVALAAASLSGCGPASGASSSTTPASSSGPSGSLATSIETSAGTWAVVPMGELDQPLNTFWQLFFRARGATRWSDEASALAVATNGGLIVATPNGRALLVGVRPANLLDYSPLLVTSNGGRAWLPASPVGALAEQPSALAIEPGDAHALALVSGHAGTEVFASSGGLSSDWQELTTAKDLGSSSAGGACGVASMTAVGYLKGQALVATSCRRPGTVGIFTDAQGDWQLVGPALPPSLDRGRVDVLGLEKASGRLWAILGVSTAHGTSLVAAWTGAVDLPWRVSAVRGLATSDRTLSFGAAGSTGLFVLTSGPSGTRTLLVLSGTGAAWDVLPTPPPGTSTVAFGAAGGVDALAVGDTSFTDWRLVASSRRWVKAQVVRVAIQFGSSS